MFFLGGGGGVQAETVCKAGQCLSTSFHFLVCPSAINMEAGLMTYTAASHQGVIERLLRPFWELSHRSSLFMVLIWSIFPFALCPEGPTYVHTSDRHGAAWLFIWSYVPGSLIIVSLFISLNPVLLCTLWGNVSTLKLLNAPFLFTR